MNRLLSFLVLLFPLVLFAQVNGPMLGYVDHMEAHIWVQGDRAEPIALAYASAETEPVIQWSPTLSSENGYTHTFVLRDLKPGTEYRYAFGNEKWSWGLKGGYTFKTETNVLFRDSLPDLRIAVGSCDYTNDASNDRPGKPYGQPSNIYKTIVSQAPDVMLWLGDNIYLREPDWGSRSGYNYRYTHWRSQDELQKLLRICSNYAIWDDHDFGPNDADGSWINSAIAKQAFMDFWANPGYGVPGAERCIATQFDHGDIGFFLVDNRTYREPADSLNSMLGGEQIDQLLNALEYSRHSFKLVAVGSQVLNNDKKYENFSNYEAERQYLLNEIERRGIKNIIFLTGDRHSTSLSKLENASGYVVYDLTISPLRSKAYDMKDDNALIMPETIVNTQNFGVLDITGKPGNRVLRMSVYNEAGKLFWEKSIRQQ